MAKKQGLASTLATIASICFVSGLLVLAGGEPTHGNIRDSHVDDRRCS